jgi:hypothetical protein
MTRGKRRNGITLSGRVQRKRTDETEIAGTHCAFIDDLAARGRITASQHRAARYFLRDADVRADRASQALNRCLPKFHAPLRQILLDKMSLAEYGKRIMGWRNPIDCETWALKMLRNALDDLGDVYRGTKKRGDEPFPGFGETEEEEEESEEAD